MITILAVFFAIFRQACLRHGFLAIALCAAVSMLLYELGLFVIGWFLGLVPEGRLAAMALTAVYTLVAVPIVYPLLRAIGKIGGEPWRE